MPSRYSIKADARGAHSRTRDINDFPKLSTRVKTAMSQTQSVISCYSGSRNDLAGVMFERHSLRAIIDKCERLLI